MWTQEVVLWVGLGGPTYAIAMTWGGGGTGYKGEVGPKQATFEKRYISRVFPKKYFQTIFFGMLNFGGASNLTHILR